VTIDRVEGDEYTGQTQFRGVAGVVRLRGALLSVVSGPDRGMKVRMQGPALLVGSSPEADVHIHDRGVSRRHVAIEACEDGVVIRDLGSKNGTWLGGARVGDVKLVKNATLSLGDTTIAVHLEEGMLDVEVADQTEFCGALGASMAMRHLFVLISRAAKASASVLFEGESGSGKEVLACALHTASPRVSKPFVAVDCASIAENLIESELFGHERGAFTGATQTHVGAFERAHGGTVFLDEIGELPLTQQAKLLRVLEAREIKRVGGERSITVDVRVVAATNRSLADDVRAKKFRSDLFYRLAVVRMVVPPLRERREDIPALAAHFLKRVAPGATLPADLVQVLLAHSWPGNVRELRNVIERWVTFQLARPEILFDTPTVHAEGGVDSAQGRVKDLADLPYHEAKRRLLEDFDRVYFPAVLDRVDGVVSKAAELAQVPRPSFHRMLARAKGNDGRFTKGR
jgi:DNA-binding NtrC family response regulator